MLKDTQRAQMINEICQVADHFLPSDERKEKITKIVFRYIPRSRQPDDDLTQDAYHNPMVKLMRTQAYREGCYGCAMTTYDQASRKWRCKAEKATGEALNYPNVTRAACPYGSKKQ